METAALFVCLVEMIMALGLAIRACHLLLTITLEQNAKPERRRARRLLGVTYGLVVVAGLTIILEAAIP